MDGTGKTKTEQYLHQLCERSFLSLWTYASVYNDKRQGAGGDGQEVCDLLVVFGNHVIIISDKACKFRTDINLDIAWARWYKAAVHESAKQIWGAERWIRTFPERLFVDRAATVRFPINIPPNETMRLHRVVVAHDAGVACRRALGGSGSLMILPSVTGNDHLVPRSEGGRPFVIGDIDPSKGFVHVLDDVTLDIVVQTLDTIADFVGYLDRRENFIRSGCLGGAAGEEDLLAYYLKKIGPDNRHCFYVPEGIARVIVSEGHWREFQRGDALKAKISADEVSYQWDALIEVFSRNIKAGTQHYCTHRSIREQEVIVRMLAGESRLRRRFLAGALVEMIRDTRSHMMRKRYIEQWEATDPYYVFLLLPTTYGTREEYRMVRRQILSDLCMIAKCECPGAKHIVGIATESGQREDRSEDAAYLDATNWTEECAAEALRVRREYEQQGLAGNRTYIYRNVKEYPVAPTNVRDSKTSIGRKVTAESARPSRNSSCPCGSGRKFKHCCWR